MRKYKGFIVMLLAIALATGCIMSLIENRKIIAESKQKVSQQASVQHEEKVQPSQEPEADDKAQNSGGQEENSDSKENPEDTQPQPDQKKEQNAEKQAEHKKVLECIYQEEDGIYTMYQSDLFDTYLIACALYFDFDSSNLIQPRNSFYQDTAEYFKQYKDHSFIQKLGDYVDSEYQDTSGDVLQSLIAYLYSNGIEEEDKLSAKEISLPNGKSLQDFIDGLTAFYEDTNARQFFADHQEFYDMFSQQAGCDIQKNEMKELIGLMEDYVGTRPVYFPDTDIHYTSLISAYRPQGASFFPAYLSKGIYFAAYESAFQEANNMRSVNMTGTIESAIHEYLHLFINPEVEKQKDSIEKLAKNRDKVEFGGQMYQYMPWYRITDENIVRAVETRIYTEYYQSEEAAFNQVLYKEIQWGGFSHVLSIYKGMDQYETNRKKYKDITSYVSTLVEILFND